VNIVPYPQYTAIGGAVNTDRRSVAELANLGDLKAAADRLALTLADVDEEEVVAEFKQSRRRKKQAVR
jgi:hypothetical protein